MKEDKQITKKALRKKPRI